jgi:hypothetical protein
MPGTRHVAAALALLWLVCGAPPPAAAAGLCAAAATDDTLRPIPEDLVPAATRLFRLQAMPAAQIQRSTVYRCLDGHVLICTTGANLPCGKADTGRRLAAADGWCAQNPGSTFIPMYVTGHATIWQWHCLGSRAAVVGRPLATDRRGFIARYWKPAE